MAITDESFETLRAAATAGDPDAARELGRLLCMLRSDLDHVTNPDFLPTWPEERWLRATLRARPDDRLAGLLLAGRLVQQINYWTIDADNANAYGEDERTLARRRDEAHALYTQALAAVPDDATARAGLATLNAWAGDADLPNDPPFSYYEVTLETGSGSYGHSESVVASHPDEVRWAAPRLLAPVVAAVPEPPFGVELTLLVHSDGRCECVVRLDEHLAADGTPRWDIIEIPPLDGDPLPVGHPVGTRHYGYSCDWG